MTSKQPRALGRFFLAVPLALLVACTVYAGGFGGSQGSVNLSGSSVSDLGDVTISSATNKDFLQHNGTAWVNVASPTLASGATLTTVGTGDLVSGDDLTVADDATITDALQVNGNTGLGNAGTDNTTILGTITAGIDGVGTAGQVLTSAGPGANMTWETAGGGASGVDGSAAAPPVRGTDANSGVFWSASGVTTNFVANGTVEAQAEAGGFRIPNALYVPGYADFTNYATFNGGMFTRYYVYSITTGVGGPQALGITDSGALVNNTGTPAKAAVLLPDAPTIGVYFDVQNVSAFLFRVVANTGDTITFPHGTSASGGYVELLTVGSGFRVTATSATTWAATQISGSERLDSTTSAGFAYTPTAWTTYTPTTSYASNTTVVGYWRQTGNVVEERVAVTFTSTGPGGVTTFTLTPQFPVDETAQNDGALAVGDAGRVIGYDDAGSVYDWPIYYQDASNVFVPIYAFPTFLAVSSAAPFAPEAGDQYNIRVSYPAQ